MQGIFVTCDSGWEDRTADEMCALVEEVGPCLVQLDCLHLNRMHFCFSGSGSNFENVH